MISQDFPPEVGGIETYAAELAKRFSEYCQQFMVFAPSKHEDHEVDQQLPYPVKRIAVSNSLIGLRAIPEMPQLLRNESIRNVFHTQWQSLPASIFAQKQGAVDRIFVAAHGRELLFNPFEHIPGFQEGYIKYKRWLLSKVDCFFPVSRYTGNLLEEHGIPPERIQVVINGTDPDCFYPKDTLKARKQVGVSAGKVMLTISRMVARKGVDTALRAFQKVYAEYPDSRYIIVGSGPQGVELEKIAADLGIRHAVIFAGRIPYDELINYYNACDVFVMPSKTMHPNVEGFGIVFLEANACGKPVVGTCSGGIPSAIVNGETGILVKEDDHKSLSEAILRLFSDEGLSRIMGGKGRRRVQEEANWDVVASKLLRNMKSKI